MDGSTRGLAELPALKVAKFPEGSLIFPHQYKEKGLNRPNSLYNLSVHTWTIANMYCIGPSLYLVQTGVCEV
jgi:hypothetical protein